ncbi:MAG: type II secretion system GspH family protein [Phycisphaerales bacterium]|nr:type II secretion system GspH family protein [Phycisphaerales bacterium]
MKRTAGFTLLEVLVVIAVIALLLGILVPVIADVQSSTRCVQGQTNLRTMSFAARNWAMEHDGQFPPALLIGTDADSTSGDVRCWDWWTRTDNATFLEPGLLWTYTSHPDRVLQCPAYDGTGNWSGPAHPTGYNYNVTFVAAMTPMQGEPGLGSWDLLLDKPALIGADGESGGTDIAIAQCRRAGQVALFGEGGYRNGANKFMRSPLHELELAYAGGQAFRHRGATNVACIDGSVHRRRQAWQGELHDQLPDAVTAFLDHPNNGFLSNDDSAYDPR